MEHLHVYKCTRLCWSWTDISWVVKGWCKNEEDWNCGRKYYDSWIVRTVQMSSNIIRPLSIVRLLLHGRLCLLGNVLNPSLASYIMYRSKEFPTESTREACFSWRMDIYRFESASYHGNKLPPIQLYVLEVLQKLVFLENGHLSFLISKLHVLL